MGFYHVGQDGLEHLTSGDPPALLASQSAGITGIRPSCLIMDFLKWNYLKHTEKSKEQENYNQYFTFITFLTLKMFLLC